MRRSGFRDRNVAVAEPALLSLLCLERWRNLALGLGAAVLATGGNAGGMWGGNQ